MLIVMGAGTPEKYKLAAARFATVIELPPYNALPAPTSSHADLLICPVGGALYTLEDYYRTVGEAAINAICSAAKLEMRFISLHAGPEYPHDVPLCAKRAGKLFISGKHTAPELLNAASNEGLRVITVRQGYAACSAAAAGECIITADRGIHDAAIRAGERSLLISPGNIDLPGYDFGFIGGCGGYCSARRELWFCGDPMTHPDGRLIGKFCRSAGVGIVSLAPERLFDCGGIFFF